MSPRQAASHSPSVPLVLIATTAALVLGYLSKQICFSVGAGDSFYCFSDYGPVYVVRELAGGRFPYFPPALEYPAGLGLIVWAAAAVTSSGVGFAQLNTWLAAAAALAIALMLWRDVERRALYFAAAPSLALYAFLNWDLLALVCAIAAIFSFVRRRDVWTGVWIGLGAAIKVFPLLLLVPMLAERLRQGDRGATPRIILAAAVPIVLLNAPVAWVSFDGWVHFLRFNSQRPVDWGTLWSVGCATLGPGLCADVSQVNALAFAVFLATAAAAWRLMTRAAPEMPRWQLAFPLIVIFFLTNKVYSPQYSLWILPWFALVLPELRLFLAYEAVDLGIYVTTFAWQQHLTGSGGLPLWPLHAFVVLRATLLVTMLVVFARRAASAPETRAR